MEILTRPARKEDADAIFRLSKGLIDEYEDIPGIPYEQVLDWVRGKIEKEIDSYRQIWVDGMHAGFYRFVPGDGVMELDDLFVFPGFQNRGIGTWVIRKCLEETDLPVMLYVFIRNTGAWKLYQRLGFEIRETVRNSRYIMVRENL